MQLFVWYTLPRKFLTSLEHKREAAEALALTLERLGGRAASYAQLCRCTETDQLLRAWESEAPTARRRLRELLDGSGIEPPDTRLLAWGGVMGFEETCIREQVATALEQAIEDGRLSPGTPGFRRRQAQVADATLSEPITDGGGRTRLQVVHAERRSDGCSERTLAASSVARSSSRSLLFWPPTRRWSIPRQHVLLLRRRYGC